MTLVLTEAIPPPSDDELPTRSKYPYMQMTIGQSFFSPVAVNTTAWTRRCKFKYVQRRKCEDGVKGYRVWRIA